VELELTAEMAVAVVNFVTHLHRQPGFRPLVLRSQFKSVPVERVDTHPLMALQRQWLGADLLDIKQMVEPVEADGKVLLFQREELAELAELAQMDRLRLQRRQIVLVPRA
jgi:hypothetical protein